MPAAGTTTGVGGGAAAGATRAPRGVGRSSVVEMLGAAAASTSVLARPGCSAITGAGAVWPTAVSDASTGWWVSALGFPPTLYVTESPVTSSAKRVRFTPPSGWAAHQWRCRRRRCAGARSRGYEPGVGRERPIG